MITNIHVELNFQISFLFPQPALLRAVICKKGVLCSRPRIKFIHVTFKSILTWEGNNRIVGGCSPEQQGPTSEGLTLLGEPCLTLSVIITQMWLQKLWSVTFLSRFTVSVCGVQRYIFVFFFFPKQRKCKIAGQCSSWQCFVVCKEMFKLDMWLITYAFCSCCWWNKCWSLQLLLYLEVLKSVWVLQTERFSFVPSHASLGVEIHCCGKEGGMCGKH